jgi:hypothetical protein
MWVAGELQSLTRTDACPVQNPAAIINEPVTGNEEFNDNYVYHVSDMRKGVRKTIEVTLKHCQHHFVEVLAKHGEIVLDLRTPGKEHCFIYM